MIQYEGCFVFSHQLQMIKKQEGKRLAFGFLENETDSDPTEQTGFFLLFG